MKTATADFENSISVGDPIFDYYSVRHDSSLPIQFTVTNTGKSKITKLTVNMTGNGESKTTEIDGFELMPNASRTITVYQPLPGEDTLIENLSYTVTAEFADSTSSSQSGTVDLQLPEVGISSVENTAEENGTRTVQIKMYNQSDIELARMEGYQVKIGFYSDNTCNTAVEGVHVAGVNGTMDENILTISDTDTLSLIDNDAFVGNFTYTLPADGFQGEEEGRTKDITLYVRAWIVDADGNEVTEYYQTNNTGSVTFTDPVARNGGNQFQITSELTAGEGGGTQATVTVKNLALTSTGNNGNLIVSLLDGSGKVIETQRSDLFSLGEEDSEDFTFHFTQSGVTVRCSYVEVSDDETDATLSSLKIDGVPLEFSPEATEYEVNTQNLKSISLSAIASNVTGAKVRIISVNGEPTTSVVLLAEEETQGSGTLDDIIPLRLPDGNGDVETNTIVLGVTPAFGNEQRYTLTIRNQRVATSGNIILETQEYTNQTGMQEVTVRLQNFGSTPESFTIQVDNDTPSSPITWLGSSESRADIAIPEAEGIHTITVKLTDESTYTTNGEITFTVDRTAPLMAENDISFVETDIPLYKANNGVSLLEGVPSETDGITENQLKVYISASDALSGIDRITADAGGRIYTAEWDDEAKKYVLMITYAFRGPLVITAYDKAGNFTSVTKSVNVDDEMPMGTILTGEAVVSYNSARLYGTVTTRDEYLATGGYGIQYRRASDSDTSWNDVLPAEGMPKDGFSVAISGLDPDTDYVYRTFVKSMANVMYYGEIRTFRTAAAPLTGTEIVSFYLEGQVGEANIDSKSGTITVTVPYQTDLEDLSRRLMSAVQISASAGAEVSIEDISVPEGSNTLTANVVVTAEDGTKQTYILTVQAQATPQIADSSFDSLRNEAGEQTITLSGTGLENASSIEILLIDELGQTASRAAAVRNTDGADGTIWTVTVNVPANSSTESDMTYTVAYLIDGVQTTTGTKITVSAASSSDCALLHFDVADAKSVTVDAVTRRITVTMPYDYTEETLNANLSVSAEASYEFRDESGKKIDALPAEGTASLVITAENGTDSVTYTVNVMIDDNLPIETILTGEAIVTSDSSATLYGTVSAQEEYLTAYGIEYRAASATEWIPSEAEEGSSQDGFSVAINGLMPDTDYVYRVYVRDAAEKMHYGEIRTFRTAAAPLTGTEIVSFYLEGRIGEANIDSESGTITVTVPYQTDLEDLSRRLISAVQISASPGAEVSIADISVSEGSNTLTATCTVTAEDGTSKTYLLIVQAQAMPQIDESSFADLTQAAGMQTVTLSGDNLENASSVEILLIDAFGQTASRAAAVWDVNEAAWKATVNVPENSSTETAAVYTVGYVIDGVQTTTGSTITVPEATNSDCALLHFDVTGAESVAVDAVTRNITVTVPYDYGSSEVGVTVSVSEGASYELRDAKGNVIAALPAEGTASLVITAENGTDSVTYTVNVVSQAAPQVHRLAFSSDPLNRQSNLTVHVEGVNLGSAKEIKVTATAADGTSVTAEAQRSGQESYTAMLVIPDYYGIYEDRIFTLSAIVDGVEQTNFDVSQASPVQVKNDNVIESFVIEGQIGETQITHNDGEQEGEIFVLMPNGTDLSALNASWTTRGGVTAQPDTLNDFTSPVIIHLSNSGQADRRYTVTVATQGTPAAEGVEFTAFTSSSAGEITITIRGKNLESLRYTTLKASDGNGGEVSSPVTVADGTLQATLTIPGNTDPTAPAEWTLALERDGAVVQTFSEKIVVQPKLEILSFAIPDQVSCSITDRTIRVRMPAGTDLSALTPQIGLPEGAVILEPQEETVDFTGTVNYRIRLGDDEETYTVIVSRQSSGGGGGGGGGTSTPGTSGDPTDPTEPADPETPTDPTEPTDPETPADPSGQQEWTDNPFEDVSDTDWYYDAVRYVKESGLMQGVSDTSFAPQSNITRGMFVTALYRLEGEPQSQEGSVRFLDVRQSAYYADAVAWASSMGIINGISSTFFAPDRTLTREQMATMIHRYYIYKGEVSSVRTTGNYADYDQISEYAREAVDFCREAGLMTGMENNSFVPKNSSTRAQMAVLLQRMLSGSTEQQ